MKLYPVNHSRNQMNFKKEATALRVPLNKNLTKIQEHLGLHLQTLSIDLNNKSIHHIAT